MASLPDCLKYVMTKDGPIIFPASLQHDTFKALNPTSAGALIVKGTLVLAYGNSMSLNLKSDPGDTAIIERVIGVCK